MNSKSYFSAQMVLQEFEFNSVTIKTGQSSTKLAPVGNLTLLTVIFISESQNISLLSQRWRMSIYQAWHLLCFSQKPRACLVPFMTSINSSTRWSICKYSEQKNWNAGKNLRWFVLLFDTACSVCITASPSCIVDGAVLDIKNFISPQKF